MTLGCVSNVYNEINALPGFLETASQVFDDIFIYHTGPGGKHSTDGTIELLEKSGVRWEFGSIDEGFGVVRTKIIQKSKSDWVWVGDADERIFPYLPVMGYNGTESYPGTPVPNLSAHIEGPVYNQSQLLRNMIRERTTSEHGAIRLCRRHWFDFSWKRPCQNPHLIPDWQLRLINRKGNCGYDSKVKMHERCVDLASDRDPIWISGDQRQGPFIDHFHKIFKDREPEQRKEDIAIYNALHEGVTKNMWVEEGFDK